MSISPKALYYLIGSFFILCFWAYNYHFPYWVVEGTYELNKPHDQHGCYDTVGIGITIRLHKDGTFWASGMGNGTYEISGTEISMDGETAGFHTSFSRFMGFGKPRLIMSTDLGCYFEKAK